MLGRIAMVAGVAMSITMTAPAGAQTPDTLQRQDTTLHVRGLKNPQLAEALGIFPGGGFFYAGDWKEGLRGYFGTVGAIGSGTGVILMGELRGCALFDLNCQPRRPAWPTRVVGGAMIAAGIAFWGYEAANAGRTVRRKNAKKIEAARDSVRSATFSDVHAFVVPAPNPRTLALGVHASW